jgi:hypothetical protein
VSHRCLRCLETAMGHSRARSIAGCIRLVGAVSGPRVVNRGLLPMSPTGSAVRGARPVAVQSATRGVRARYWVVGSDAGRGCLGADAGVVGRCAGMSGARWPAVVRVCLGRGGVAACVAGVFEAGHRRGDLTRSDAKHDGVKLTIWAAQNSSTVPKGSSTGFRRPPVPPSRSSPLAPSRTARCGVPGVWDGRGL